MVYSHVYQPKAERAWARNKDGYDLQVLPSSNPLLLDSPQFLKVPQGLPDGPLASDPVFRHMSLWGALHI